MAQNNNPQAPGNHTNSNWAIQNGLLHPAINGNHVNFHWALQEGLLFPAFGRSASIYNGFVSTNNALALNPTTHMDHIPRELHQAMLVLPDRLLYATSDLGKIVCALAECDPLRPMNVDTAPHDFYHIMCDEEVRKVSRGVLKVEEFRRKEDLLFHASRAEPSTNSVKFVESVKLAKFPGFGKLATEIQLLIWKHAAHIHEKKEINVRLRITPSQFHGDNDDEDTLSVMVVSARYEGKVPALFHACQNSRKEAMNTLDKLSTLKDEVNEEKDFKKVYWKHSDTMVIEHIEYSATA